MNYLKEFLIPFRGLSIGVHNYKWEISHKFFEAFDNSEIDDATIEVELNLEKQERMMICNFVLTGSITVKCNRCLNDLELPVDLNETLYVKLGAERVEESEDVVTIPDTEYRIDVGTLINEYITLSIPLKKVHPVNENGESGCDSDMIKKLEELSGKNKVDPRWEQLKNLKLD